MSSKDQVISVVEYVPKKKLRRHGFKPIKVSISWPATTLAVRNPSVAPNLSWGEFLSTKIIWVFHTLVTKNNYQEAELQKLKIGVSKFRDFPRTMTLMD